VDPRTSRNGTGIGIGIGRGIGRGRDREQKREIEIYIYTRNAVAKLVYLSLLFPATTSPSLTLRANVARGRRRRRRGRRRKEICCLVGKTYDL